MKICAINYQSFKANNNDNNCQKSFMGRVSDGISGAIDGVTSAIDTTSKAAEGFSDIAKSARNALSSPEEATIGVLTDQIDDKVVNNEKVPNWLRKTASYGSAALAAGGTFIAVRKTPGVIKNFIVNNLSKFKWGKSILNGLSSVKKSMCRFANMLGKEQLSNLFKRIGKFINKKSPKFIKSSIKKCKLDKIKNWTSGDYAKNAVAAYLGYQTGGNVLNKHQDKIDTKNIKNNPPKDDIAESEITETDDTDFSKAA